MSSSSLSFSFCRHRPALGRSLSLFTLNCHPLLTIALPSPAVSVAFSSATAGTFRTILVAGCCDGSILLADPLGGTVVRHMRDTPHGASPVTAVAPSRDGSALTTGDVAGRVVEWKCSRRGFTHAEAEAVIEADGR
jgi:WD40 repeat protein